MRHFAHHIGDYAAATAHLSFVEDAAYHRLLRRYYQDERPLPKEVSAAQRLVGARTKEEREAVAAVLGEFFTLQEDGWHQARADEEVAGYRARVDVARENGRKSGGRPKPKKKPDPNRQDNRPDNQVGSPSVPDEVTNHEPVREAPTGLPVTDQTPSPVAARASEPEGLATPHDDLRFSSFLKRMT